MQVTGAVVREQGQTFAIVVVKPHILDSRQQSAEAQRAFQPRFPGVPVVLMADGPFGRPRYWGRRDIVNFLANTDPARIPWRQYTIG